MVSWGAAVWSVEVLLCGQLGCCCVGSWGAAVWAVGMHRADPFQPITKPTRKQMSQQMNCSHGPQPKDPGKRES